MPGPGKAWVALPIHILVIRIGRKNPPDADWGDPKCKAQALLQSSFWLFGLGEREALFADREDWMQEIVLVFVSLSNGIVWE